MILMALSDAGGVKYLTEQALANPAAFLTLLGKVLPLTIAGDRDKSLQLELSREELREQSRREIDEAFREYRPPGHEEERPNGRIIEHRSSPVQDGDPR